MTRRIAGALLVVLLTGAACGGASSDREGADGSGTVELLVFGSPEEIAAYRSLVDAFEADHEIDVELIEAADRDDLLTRLSTSFAGGSPPDLFLVNYRFYEQYASRDVLEPVAPYVDRSDVIDEDDFYAVALDAFRRDGELTCVPQNVSSLAVYFNEDLFEAAGLDAPAAGWTWDDMIERARSLTVDTDGDGAIDQFGLGVEPELIRLAPFVWSNGGEIVDDEADPSRMTLDSPEALEVLQDFLDLYVVDGVIPSELEFESEDNEARFANGRMAMVMQSRRSTSYFRTITDFDWDVAPLPVYDEPAGVLHSDAYCMAAASPDKDEAWRFVEYAVGPLGAPIVAASGRTVPSLRSVAESDAFLDPGQEPESSQVFLDAIPTVRRTPAISTGPEIEDEVALLLEIALWREPRDAAAVAADIDAATRELFARSED